MGLKVGYLRILAINVVAAFFGMPNRSWSMCEENTAYGKSHKRPLATARIGRLTGGGRLFVGWVFVFQ